MAKHTMMIKDEVRNGKDTTSNNQQRFQPYVDEDKSFSAQTWTRLLRYHLYSCADTNKSQYVIGGLSVLIAPGRSDAANVL